jgi:membrane protein required for colicin V production
MEFTVVDAGVAVVTLLSGILAYSRGFTRELFAIGGWVLAAVAAYFGAPMLQPLIHEIPAVGPILAESCVISLIVAFTVVVAVALMILSVFTPVIAGLVLDSVLGPLDRMLGFLFGIARGLVLVVIAFLIYTHYSGGDAWEPLDRAASKALFEEASTLVQRNTPDWIFDWMGEKMEALMVNCPSDGPGAASGTESEGGAAAGATTGAPTTGN